MASSLCGRQWQIGAAREAPAITVEPTGFVFRVRVAAERADAGSLILLEGLGEFAADGRIARAIEVDEEDTAIQRGREEIGRFASEMRHCARAARGGEWEEELAGGLDGGEPGHERMCGAGTDDDDVGGLKWAARAISMDDGDLRPWLECDARTGGEAFIDFYGGDSAGGAGELGEDRGIVAGSGTEMENPVASPHAEDVEMNGPEAGLAVVEVFGLVENDEGVAIEASRIAIFSEPGCAATLDDPRTGAYETLARNVGEGSVDGR